MNLFTARGFIKVCIALCVALLCSISNRVASADAPSTQPRIAGEKTSTGYLMATTPRSWSFPLDHGRHDGFKTEWWYFAGNVADEAGRKFGYQLAFFRVSISPIAFPRDSALTLGDYYLVHAAISDLEGGSAHQGQFYFKDRMEPEHAGVTTSAADTLDVALRDWSAKLGGPLPSASTRTATLPSQPANDVIALNATDTAFAIHLNCNERVGERLLAPVLQGPGGVNAKGRLHGEDSYYYSIPRLPTAGVLVVDGKTFHVTGNTWMDHEFSSNALGPDQVGWDWVGLQLADGSDLMVYRIRDKSGNSDYLSGTLIDRAGNPKYLTAHDITFVPNTDAANSTIWKSASGGAYPQSWRLTVAGLPPLTVRSRMPGQELRTDATTKIDYFEGSCAVIGDGGKLVGEGYLEMTGYAKPINPF